jgi:hypothetical protein
MGIRGLFWPIVLLMAPTALFAQDFRSPLILSPYSVSAGEVLVGKTSSPQIVTLVNTGPDVVHITDAVITGDFTETNGCPVPPAGLGHNETCTIEITFRPRAVGPASGTLTVSDDIPGGPLTVVLSGSGTLGTPKVKIAPSSLTFPEQKQGITSAPQTATISNSGQRALLISNISVSGDFTILPSSTCEALVGSLATNSSCTLAVTFAPLGSGTRAGQVTITDDAENSPQKLLLSGIGAH